MKNKTKVLGICLLTTVFLFAAAGSGSSDDSASKVGEVTTTSTSAEQSEAGNLNSNADDDKSSAENTDISASTTDVALKESYKVGDILQSGDLKIVYVSSGEYTSNNQFIQPKDGNKFIFIELYCENTGSSDTTVSSFSFECYADGYSCESAYISDNELSATLSPGRNTSGRIGFEIPEDAQDVQIEYSVDVWTNEKIIFDYEGNMESGFVPEAVTTASENAFKVGDIVETKDLRITYLSCGEYQSTNMFDDLKDGYHYIYCELEFENISNSDQYVSFYDFDCFADGADCEGYYGMDNELDGTISPSRKTKGTVAFEVPINATNVEVEYVSNLFTSDRIIFSYQP